MKYSSAVVSGCLGIAIALTSFSTMAVPSEETPVAVETIEKVDATEMELPSFKQSGHLMFGPEMLYRRVNVELGYNFMQPFQFALSYTSFEKYEGWVPTEMWAASVRHFPKGSDVGGWYVGGGLTHVRLKPSDFGMSKGFVPLRIKHVFVGGYQKDFSIFKHKMLFQLGAGYGVGSPGARDDNEPEQRFMGGIFDYTYFEVGLGWRI